MLNDVSTNDLTNKPKKGLLQSLHSLTFSDDSQDDDDDKPIVASTPAMSGPVGPVGPATVSPLSSEPVVKSEPTPPQMPVRPVMPTVEPVKPVTPAQPPVNTFVPSVSMPPTPSTPNVVESPLSETELADPSVTLDTIEDSLTAEMRRSMDSVKASTDHIKEKTNYDLVTDFGVGAREVLMFNTFLTKELPYTSKTGKNGTQRVNFFGVLTESGVYAVRASSAITSKLEDALKHSLHMKDETVGLLGDGSARRIVLKLPAEEYGSANVLHIPLVGDESKQSPDTFTGLDAVNVDMQFIEDLMSLAVNEVEAMLDYEKRRRANLKDLQNKTNAEVRKASVISEKLSTISL